MRRQVLVLAALLGACAPAASPTPRDPAAEARAFMEGYGRDLIGGNREGIADRYDRRGAYLLGNGRKDLEPFDSIAARYRTEWSPPPSFEWQNLSFEPVGPDAVAVAGQFLWGREGAAPLAASYSALLVRQEGRLRIRIEDESIDPRALRPACPDTTRR